MKENFEDVIEDMKNYDSLSIVAAVLNNIVTEIFCITDIMASYEQMDEVINEVDPYLCRICFNVEKAAKTLYECYDNLTLDDVVKSAVEQANEIIRSHRRESK